MTAGGVLMDPCDHDNTCNLDENMFKGIFARNLRYLMDVTTDKGNLQIYWKFLRQNIASLEEHASCQPGKNQSCHIVYLDGAPSYPATGPVYDSVWRGPFNQSRPIQHTSALDLLVAGVEGGVRCRGQGCHYDPRHPQPRPLTCKDDPCPEGQQCCEFQSQFTCCAPGQICSQGYCQ